jgi:signal transduction histidine kinase
MAPRGDVSHASASVFDPGLVMNAGGHDRTDQMAEGAMRDLAGGDQTGLGESLTSSVAPAGRRRFSGLVDLGPAFVLAGFSVVLLGLPYRQHLPSLPPFEVGAVAALATTLPLVLRRNYPELVLVVVGVSYVWYVELQTQQLSGPSLAIWLAIFSVGAYGRSRWMTPVRALVALGLSGFVALHVLSAAPTLGGDLPFVLLASVSYNAFLYAASWLMGDWYRQRERYEQELDRRARQLERERLERERRVVRDERVRIARELHDVVAHHVSLMGIQAGAARTVLDDSPTRTRDLLGSIEASSRRAVDEMRRLLSALREEATPDSADRPPNLAQLGTLMESARAAGLDATLTIRGAHTSDLPETLDLSAYRIVQEALTNVIRHAAARHVQVLVTYSPMSLDLRITDDGRGNGAEGPTGGRGLVGMRERTALFGGALKAGPQQGGGFAVEAHLPIPLA